MNRTAATAAALAGALVVAVIALALGGSTYSAVNDFGDVDGNVVAAGFLQVNLDVNGSRDAPLDLRNLAPGNTGRQTAWVSSDSRSATPANLYLTFHDLADTAAPCSTSPAKTAGEHASGVGGCTVTDGVGSGTPEQGNLSRVLVFQVARYTGIGDAAACAKVHSPAPGNPIMAEAPGNMRASAEANGGAGTPYELTGVQASTPLQLSPGSGACIGIDAYWPYENDQVGRPSQDYPSDDAAQGDSLTVDVRFDLSQAG